MANKYPGWGRNLRYVPQNDPERFFRRPARHGLMRVTKQARLRIALDHVRLGWQQSRDRRMGLSERDASNLTSLIRGPRQ
jgi:hypothetical protein